MTNCNCSEVSRARRLPCGRYLDEGDRKWVALILSDFLSEFRLDMQSALVELDGSSPAEDGDSSKTLLSAAE